MLLGILIAALIRIYIFEPYKVTSNSMEPTLHQNNFVVIEKYSFGMYHPRSILDIPWINICYIITQDENEILNLANRRTGVNRSSTTNNIKRSDVVLVLDPNQTSRKLIKRCYAASKELLPNSAQLNLEMDTVPYKGMNITLNYKTPLFYRNILETYECPDWNIGKKRCSLKMGSTYTLTQNYIFVLGDNVNQSIDSRTWGFIPTSYVLGKMFL